jgi:peptide/nickel transport system permease protein
VTGGSGLADIVESARLAEQAGFESVWATEFYDRSATVSIAAMAAATEKLTLGSAIAYAFGRTPIVWAAEARDLDELTGGRLIVGLGTGLLAAWRRGTLVDKTATAGAMVVSSLQIYFLGPLALAILVYQTHWFDKPAYNNFTGDPLTWFTGLIIPWVVLSTIFAAQYTRMARSSMIEQLQEEHVRTARAKGMSRRYVFFRYAWRGSLIPIVTIFGIDLGSLLGGAIITEYTFGLPGLGQLAVQSVFFSDLPLLLGVMLFAATMILLFNIVVDAAYALIDPRIRLA